MKTHMWALNLALLTVSAFGQMAPRGEAKTHLDGKELTIEYGRPSLKGRSVTDLTAKLPADRIWRAGAEKITTLTTEGAIMISGAMVPAGTYSLYLHCPESGPYSLVLNSVLGQPLKKIWAEAPAELADKPWPHVPYQEAIGNSEVARIPLEKSSPAAPADLLTFAFAPQGPATLLQITWGKDQWTATVEGGSMHEGSHHDHN